MKPHRAGHCHLANLFGAWLAHHLLYLSKKPTEDNQTWDDRNLFSVLREGVQALLGGNVPNLDGVVGGSGNEMAVVRREGDGQHPAGVTREGADKRSVAPEK